MSLSNAVENKLLDALCGGTGYSVSSPTLALVSVAVTESDTASSITKLTYTGYADHSLNNSTEMNAASGGSKTNSAVIDFPTRTDAGATQTAVGFAILSGSDVVLYGALSSNLSITQNVQPQFDVAALTLTAD